MRENGRTARIRLQLVRRLLGDENKRVRIFSLGVVPERQSVDARPVVFEGW